MSEPFPVISEAPIEIDDRVQYELRRVGCARCGAVMLHAPWPTNSTELRHRPRCGRCRSTGTYPMSDSLKQSGFDFAEAVKAELASVRLTNRPLNSAHEGYAVLFEELDEFWEEVKKQSGARNPHAMWCELVQVATVAQRIAEDIVAPALPAVGREETP